MLERGSYSQEDLSDADRKIIEDLDNGVLATELEAVEKEHGRGKNKSRGVSS